MDVLHKDIVELVRMGGGVCVCVCACCVLCGVRMCKTKMLRFFIFVQTTHLDK